MRSNTGPQLWNEKRQCSLYWYMLSWEPSMWLHSEDNLFCKGVQLERMISKSHCSIISISTSPSGCVWSTVKALHTDSRAQYNCQRMWKNPSPRQGFLFLKSTITRRTSFSFSFEGGWETDFFLAKKKKDKLQGKPTIPKTWMRRTLARVCVSLQLTYILVIVIEPFYSKIDIQQTETQYPVQGCG